MISIVVPVYKVEKYLDRCINSLIHQSLDDIEIILVDDGSPDNCPQMCDEWSKKDNRIKVVHKKNGGLSSARNAGLEIAKGEYVGFVDSDDDVELNMFEILYEAAKKEEADFVMSDYIRILSNGMKIPTSTSLRAGLFEKNDIIKEIYPSLIMGENVDYGPILSTWNCMYNREFLFRNRIRFANDVKWSEDNLFNAIVGYCAKRFVYVKGNGLYHYYQNPGTITTSYRSGAWDVYKRMNAHLHSFFSEKKGYDFGRQLKLHMIYYACNTINMESVNAGSLKEATTRVKNILNDPELMNAFKDFELPRVSWKLKMQLWIMKHRYAAVLASIIRGR